MLSLFFVKKFKNYLLLPASHLGTRTFFLEKEHFMQIMVLTSSTTIYKI